MTPFPPQVTDVDFTAPGTVDPSDFGLDGLTSAAARVSVDLSPTSGLGASRLGQIRRVEGSTVSSANRTWCHVKTGRGEGVLLVDQSLAVVVADLLMGGTGAVDYRPITSVEERVLAPHLQRVMSALSVAFQPAGLGQLEVGEPGRSSPGLRGDMFSVEIVVTRDQDPDSEPLGSLVIVVPALESHRAARGPDGMGTRSSAMSEAALAIPLSLSVHTGVTMLTAAEVRGLNPGDVLELAHDCAIPLRVLVGGVDVACGALGSHESTLTVLLESGLSPARRPAGRLHRIRRPRSSVFYPDDARLIAAAVYDPVGPDDLPAGFGNAGQSYDGDAEDTDIENTLDDLMNLLEGESEVNIDDSVVAQAVSAAEDALGAADTPSAEVRSNGQVTLGVLADVPVEVSVEVGRTQISLRDAVALGPGQVVTLDAEADSQASVLVNGRLVARGQVVVVDNVYGVRISELVEE